MNPRTMLLIVFDRPKLALVLESPLLGTSYRPRVHPLRCRLTTSANSCRARKLASSMPRMLSTSTWSTVRHSFDSSQTITLTLSYGSDNHVRPKLSLDILSMSMGYPAVGVSALYRNRRRDVLKFINTRHGDKWWIWNLCPLYENAYSPESMFGRVSRYPFPDHHPPPLPLLPLAVREMTAWLQGDQERIAIIHCKAGKVGINPFAPGG